MVIPSLEDFKRMAAQGTVIPIVEEVHFDWETPISAFRKIDDGMYSFLLESVEGGEKWGRYSFLGSRPSHLFRSKGDEFEILKNGEVIQKGTARDPLRSLEDFLRNFRPVAHGLLRDFLGVESVISAMTWLDLLSGFRNFWHKTSISMIAFS